MLGQSSSKLTASNCLVDQENLARFAESWYGHTLDGMVRIVCGSRR
jgi:hypothetical protein